MAAEVEEKEDAHRKEKQTSQSRKKKLGLVDVLLSACTPR